MQLPGLTTIKPHQTDLLDRLAKMMGTSFLKEPWTEVWFTALDEIGSTPERKAEISQAVMTYDFLVGAPFECVYALPDFSAGAGGYLLSELGGQTWNTLEEQAVKQMSEAVLDEQERRVLLGQAARMKHISNFSWFEDDARGADFIHFFSIGVDTGMQGRGILRKLLGPFLDYADELGINCYLECYNDRNESIYSHFDFETVQRFTDPEFEIFERCMVRRPQNA